MKTFIKTYAAFSKKRIFINICIVFLFTFLQFYLSMRKLSNNISSGCLDCSFFEDIFVISIFSCFFLIILFYSFTVIKQKIRRITLQYIFLILIWFFFNYTVFVDRESSWSTYLFHEEIYFTIRYSFIPIVILSSVLILILNFINSDRQKK